MHKCRSRVQFNALSHIVLYERTVQHASEPRRRLRCWAQHCTAYQHAYPTCIDVLQAGYCGAAAHGRRKLVCLFPTPVGEDDLHEDAVGTWPGNMAQGELQDLPLQHASQLQDLPVQHAGPTPLANLLPSLKLQQLVDHSASLNSSAVRSNILLRSVELPADAHLLREDHRLTCAPACAAPKASARPAPPTPSTSTVFPASGEAPPLLTELPAGHEEIRVEPVPAN